MSTAAEVWRWLVASPNRIETDDDGTPLAERPAAGHWNREDAEDAAAARPWWADAEPHTGSS